MLDTKPITLDSAMHSVKRLAHIDFNIPGLKPVGMELMKQLNTLEPDMDKIVHIVELDPALFGTILACANSPLFGGISEIVSIRVAINRLGFKEIRRIVFHVVLESAFRSDNTEINKFLRTLWKQNLAVSLTMQRLVQDCPQVKALPLEMVAMIYPLGLMHVIGIPVLIINYFEAFAKFLREDISKPLPEVYQQEKTLFDGFDHFELGAELVKRWDLPIFFSTIMAVYQHPEPSLDPNSRILHSLLRYARQLAHELGLAALPNAPEGFWLQGNTLDLSEVDSVAVMADVVEQMKRITSLFS